ncbi:type I 3-dehydroquinate dehydratase [Chimaeribacter arupi]|uniref:type I 3-dehydroquinate dehydratase n=1 Tax=Chimaeribacter arupi TaxID=2060066 RepID=UPI000C7D4206|nr:type I 3-dehydroquinate dehydratase [Chimaeribacter arupi]PLR35352.1 type I 3-dehydroquinate dehydratase [Chimaeribacter arupi]
MKRREFMLSGAALAAGTLVMRSAAAAPAGHVEEKGSALMPPVTDRIKTLTIKGTVIGEGKPKLIVPTTATTPGDALAAVKKYAGNPAIQVVELRIDTLRDTPDNAAIAALTREAWALLPDQALLVTFRTKAEGGNRAISDDDYAALCREIITHGKADLLDIEMFRGEAQVKALVALAHQANMAVVMSSHDFRKTPSAEEIITRLRRQQALGADVLKIAAMPQDSGDVLRLMSATWEMHSRYAERPLLTMAMSGSGVVSRLAGELTGSALTFGMVGEASAPGQIEADDLSRVLNIIHTANQA